MSQAAKTINRDNVSARRSSEADLLLFLKRTLQFHSSDAEKEDVFEKLQNLKKALDQQEATLLSWPDSPSKNRIRESLAQARRSVAQIVDDFGGATRGRFGDGDAKT
jgi:hypothetical protein